MKKIRKLLHSKKIGKKGRLFILIFLDAILIISSVLIVFFVLQNESIYPLIYISKWLIPSLIFLGLPFYLFSNQYQSLTRYVGAKSFYALASRNGILLILIAFISEILGLPRPSKSSWILIWITLSLLSTLFRFAARDLLINFDNANLQNSKRVAIYGSGSAAVQLVAALKVSGRNKIVCFIEDIPALWGRTIWDIPIKSEKFLEGISNIEQILLAKPSMSQSKRRSIIKLAKNKNISVMQIPSLDDLTTGKAKIDSLEPISIEDLLGRDSIKIDISTIKPNIQNKSICVTGGGGSIGFELCNQIISLNPKYLIIIDNNEPSLYQTNQELKNKVPKDTTIVPVLGSAKNYLLLKETFETYKVNIIFHAAAYKHVPIVENNPMTGIENNVFATKTVCEAAVNTNIEQVILISTDKAVRPENIMGASKRLSELIIQGYAEEEKKKSSNDPYYPMTLFSMVRFGNVLASSGSVVPLFKKQILNGGPVTLTHKDIVRYFMTISEATQLVLISSSMAQGGDVFLLDMGEPVKIILLAEQMIKLSGLKVKNNSNPNGDIEIIETGLRPGEKLFEELLINAEAKKTNHPLIFRAVENSWPFKELINELKFMKKNLDINEKSKVLMSLSKLVPEWNKFS
ncbi:UDP-N-acetylglucosamine 4,6-dehydratase [Prochlorococcus marinus str. MIT 9321]|uniref:polysaccharide biosynthesis protein n=1 Tax=Prochlorococcus TaxID=1218 RepID=UPI00051611DB|nr:nucleoside-diphosphate sugar epimerase/dehydratase [Prochlorococcus marinus]KGG02877.1 UDP-N-acetylglucosamine 4,6-dehydratase [Prochlorococcus marinus str. MIT 9321]